MSQRRDHLHLAHFLFAGSDTLVALRKHRDIFQRLERGLAPAHRLEVQRLIEREQALSHRGVAGLDEIQRIQVFRSEQLLRGVNCGLKLGFRNAGEHCRHGVTSLGPGQQEGFRCPGQHRQMAIQLASIDMEMLLLTSFSLAHQLC